jgi:hypothetical protein
MKWLWFLLVFILGGLVGVFVGGAVGMMAGGITGTEFGVCAAVDVAEKKGILSADQAQALLADTAAHLRSEFKELVEKSKISEKMPLNSETCQKMMSEVMAAK